MGRAEHRRALREDRKAKTATYNLTETQLNAMIQERIKDDIARIKREATEDAVNTAMTLMLALPLEVLMDHYWQKSYEKRLPEFVDHVLEYYRMWQDDELDMDELKRDLWEYGGVRLEERVE